MNQNRESVIHVRKMTQMACEMKRIGMTVIKANSLTEAMGNFMLTRISVARKECVDVERQWLRAMERPVDSGLAAGVCFSQQQ